MISEEKLKEIMNGIENRIRHAYNCGWNDGFSAMKEKITKDIQERIEESIDKAMSENTEKPDHDGCVGCKYIKQEIDMSPCNMCKHSYQSQWTRIENE